MTRHPLPYLVIALLVLAANFVATPRAAPTNVAGLYPVGRVEASSDLRWGQLGAPRSQAEQRSPGALPSSSRPQGETYELGGAPLPMPALITEPAASPYQSGIGTALIGGYATWHDACRRCAAAGPHLRAMLGPDWRGMAVEVQGPGWASVTVLLSDACACGERHGLPTLIDLSADAFAELAPLDWGVVAVSIETGGRPTLPATDTRKEPSRE